MNASRLRQSGRERGVPDVPQPPLLPGVAASLLLHAAVVLLILSAPSLGSAPRIPPGGAITVSLVSAPGPGGPAAVSPAPAEAAAAEKPPAAAAPPPAPAPVRETPPPPVARAVPEPPKPEVSLAPKPIQEKKSLKEATKDPRKMIDRAIERIEKKVAEPEPGAAVAQAIEQLKKKLAEEEKRAPAAGTGGAGAGGTPGAAGAGSGGGGGGGPGTITALDIYRAAIAAQVERNWAFSPQLAGGNRNLRVGLVFKVLPNGEITDIRFTERSNNAYLDESAYRAILKSNPAPPHPPSVREPFVVVAIRFTPEGIR